MGTSSAETTETNARRAMRLAAVVVAITVVATVYAMLPVPSEGLHSPRLRSLQGYKGSGCGLSTMHKATMTYFYRKLPLSASKRQEIREELLSLGYSAQGQSYVKKSGGLFPITYQVRMDEDGSVALVAVRHKLPFK
jgi:hypothetical protein